MTPEERARFNGLCELAAQELDPEKLLDLAEEINRILLREETRASGKQMSEAP